MSESNHGYKIPTTIEVAFVWLAPSGAQVEITAGDVEALARVERHLGGKVAWWRTGGGEWNKP
mgnify:CR=1 FL=1